MHNCNLGACQDSHLVAEGRLAERSQQDPEAARDLVGRNELREGVPVVPTPSVAVLLQENRVQWLRLGHAAEAPGRAAVDAVVEVPVPEPLERQVEADAGAGALQARQGGVGLRVAQEGRAAGRQPARRERREGVHAVAHDALALAHHVLVLVVLHHELPQRRQRPAVAQQARQEGGVPARVADVHVAVVLREQDHEAADPGEVLGVHPALGPDVPAVLEVRVAREGLVDVALHPLPVRLVGGRPHDASLERRLRPLLQKPDGIRQCLTHVFLTVCAKEGLALRPTDVGDRNCL
mmetsp:Transcript_57474/g.115165  ORF Transcript_57474/g.115165 Transcript_57474/m.115165 type:complete len:294 (-) Transcript_57474:227-1108(-)